MTAHFLVKSVADWRSSRATRSAVAADPVVIRRRIEAGVDWLLASIEACDGQASSKAYRIGRGWMPPYPETTGYIIPTLYIAGEFLGRTDLDAIAERMGYWLISAQRPDGGFTGRHLGSGDPSVVFDTGMILFGFNALYYKTKRPEFLKAGDRAAQFLIASMGENGNFIKNCDYSMPHAYNVRAAWALGAFGYLAEKPKYVEKSIQNAEWTVKQQTENGFYRCNQFKPGGNANTHGIAYVMQGLVELSVLANRADLLESVKLAADRIGVVYQERGELRAEIGPDWEFLSTHQCLTGYAQLAIVLLRLTDITKSHTYADLAEKLLRDVLSHQNVATLDKRHRGALAGSFPIYGRYAPMQYPNWATKFLVDALVEKEKHTLGIDRALELRDYAN